MAIFALSFLPQLDAGKSAARMTKGRAMLPWTLLTSRGPTRWIGDKARRRGLGAELPRRKIRKLQYLLHLGEIDLVHRIGCVVIVGMKAGEPPQRRDVMQHKRKLVGAEEHVQCRLMVEPVIERQAHQLVLLLDRPVIVGRVECADQVKPIDGIAGYRDQSI